MGLLLGPAIHAQEPGGNGPDEEGLADRTEDLAAGIEEALSLDPATDLDAALAAAWKARFSLPRIEDPIIRADLDKRVRERLTRHDPAYASTNKDLSAAAKRLAMQAANYARQDWFEVATRLLDEADRFDSGSTQDARDRIAKDRSKLQRATDPAAIPKLFIHSLENVHESKGWTRSEFGYLANLEGRRGVKLEALGTRHEDARIRLDVYPPENGRTQAGLMFARLDSISYLLLDAAWNAGEKLATLRLYEVFDGGDINLLTNKEFAVVQTDDGPRIRILVEVEGKTVRFGTEGAPFVHFEYAGRTYGSVGFVVSGHGKHEGSVEFRNLSIETLTPLVVGEGAKDEANLAAVRARTHAGRMRANRDEQEGATMEFLAAVGLLANLASQDLIRTERETIDAHWSDADPQFRKHSSTRRHIATKLEKRAKAYRMDGQVRTALVLLDEATRVDAQVAFESREDVRGGLER